MMPNSIAKLMKNQCWVFARKSYATIMEDGWKMDAELEQQSIKIMKSEVPNTMRKKRRTSRWSAGRARAPSQTQHLLFVSWTSLKRLNVYTLRLFVPLRYTHRLESSPDVNLKGSALPANPNYKIENIKLNIYIYICIWPAAVEFWILNFGII